MGGRRCSGCGYCLWLGDRGGRPETFRSLALPLLLRVARPKRHHSLARTSLVQRSSIPRDEGGGSGRCMRSGSSSVARPPPPPPPPCVDTVKAGGTRRQAGALAQQPTNYSQFLQEINQRPLKVNLKISRK